MSKILIKKYSFLCVFYFNFLVNKTLFFNKTFLILILYQPLRFFSIIININNKIFKIKKK